MPLIDRAAIELVGLAAETTAGRAAIAASARCAHQVFSSMGGVGQVAESALSRAGSALLPQPTEKIAGLLGEDWVVKDGLRIMQEMKERVLGGHTSEYAIADSTHTNAELAELVSSQRIKDSRFASFHDLGIFTSEPAKVPAGRVTTGYFLKNEDYWLDSMQQRFATGHIDAHTLLVADTGHGPTIAYAMAKRFRSDIFMHLPDNAWRREYFNNPQVFKDLVQDQGQTFFRGIHEALQAGNREGGSTLLTKYYHAPALSDQVANSLPPVDYLESLGIKKVFYGLEFSPRPTGPAPWIGRKLNPLEEWLTKIHNGGKPVVWDGLDIRPWTSQPFESASHWDRYVDKWEWWHD